MTKHVISPADYEGGERFGRGQYRSGDAVTIQQGLVWFSEGVALQGKPAGGQGVLSDLDIDVRGEIVGINAGIDLESAVTTAQGSDIIVRQTGVVLGLHHGLLLKGGSDNVIDNRGVIGGTEHGIRAGGEVEIKNQGLIGTMGTYHIEAPRYHAISITHGVARIENAGGIGGVDAGLEPERQAVIRIAEGARLELTNGPKALIQASSGTAILGGDRSDTVSNFGLIEGEVDLRGGSDTFFNVGTIDGALRMGAGDDTVQDEGGILGGVWLGDGDDTYKARSFYTDAAVHGGQGDDTYRIMVDVGVRLHEAADGGYDTIHSATSIQSFDHIERLVLTGDADASAHGSAGRNVIRGNAGDNLLKGLAGDDEIIGGAGNDRIQGGEGADRLSGWDGDDRLRGGSGVDRLHGGNGADRVRGGPGDDELSGGIGDDRVLGGNGDDRLIGGEGADRLAGGRGADDLWSGWGDDVFVWNRAGDAGTERGTRDVVHDFNPARDTLRFDFELAYREGRFSGERAEIRLVEKGADTFARIDADGDGGGDMTIVLRGVTGLGEDVLAL